MIKHSDHGQKRLVERLLWCGIAMCKIPQLLLSFVEVKGCYVSIVCIESLKKIRNLKRYCNQIILCRRLYVEQLKYLYMVFGKSYGDINETSHRITIQLTYQQLKKCVINNQTITHDRQRRSTTGLEIGNSTFYKVGTRKSRILKNILNEDALKIKVFIYLNHSARKQNLTITQPLF